MCTFGNGHHRQKSILMEHINCVDSDSITFSSSEVPSELNAKCVVEQVIIECVLIH